MALKIFIMMIDLTKKKYSATKLGFKVRAHRIILQLALIALFIYWFGWLTFLMVFLLYVLILFVEVIPYGKWDLKLNPWLRKEDEQVLSSEFEKWLQNELKRDLEG
jgi:fatty acid desaturase